MKKKTFRQLEVILHVITVATLLLKGYDEVKRGLFFPGGIIIGFAFTALIIALFWRRLYIKPRIARTACYYIEAPALLLTSYVLYLENKEFLPDIFLIAAILYPAFGFISSKKFKKLNKAASPD
jgi:hypothetical protein